MRHRGRRAGARSRALLVLAAGCGAVVLLWVPVAPASAPPSPWDGVNPFHCVIQDAGRDTKVPDPGADPYCVHFDKTNQNITQLGLVSFLSKEPARAGAAAPKCFYFQEDHWRGSVVQSDGRTVIYEFVGHYFFNKATGDGGAWVQGFSVGGQTFDPASLPGFPPQYGRYFGPGTGGVITHDSVRVDPSCAARAESDPAAIYAAAAGRTRCAPRRAPITARGIGPLVLGAGEGQVRAALGPPRSVRRGFLRYCVAGGGALLVGQAPDRSGTLGYDPRTPTLLLLTGARGYRLAGTRARPGQRRRSLDLALRGLHRVGGTRATWLRRGPVLAEIVRNRVRLLGVYDRRALHSDRALRTLLRRVG